MRAIFLLMFINSVVFSQASNAEVKCDDKCYCGESLKNLEITIPKGTRLTSACFEGFNPTGMIDLHNKKLSLDRYDDYGNFPRGKLFLEGSLTVPGVLMVNEEPGGVLWFSPEWEFSSVKTPISIEMSIFKFKGEESIFPAFNVDTDLISKGCSFAPVKIQVGGFLVFIFDTDEGGTYPYDVNVLSIGDYQPCAKQDS